MSLKKTCEYNEIVNAELLNLAICAEDGYVFIEDRDGHEMNRIVEDKGIKVIGKKLDTVIDEHNLNRIDFLKMNIEGAEKFAILGMEETLKITKNLCISCHDFLAEKYNNDFYRTKTQVINFLRNNSFKVIEREHEVVWTSDMIYARNNNI